VSEFAEWESFYVLVGTAAAALMSVQFVVVTLIATLRVRTTADSIHAFGTPTVVHLGAALMVSAMMIVPWPSLSLASVALATCGLGGLGYGAIVVVRALRQTGYKPVWEDWLWYATLPCSIYAALAFAALSLEATTRLSLFMIGGAALGLLLVAIHNAWDTVTHIVISSRDDATTTE
jgi:hypothetical protein